MPYATLSAESEMGAMQNYTFPPIKGVDPERFLPEGTALVLEGGGTRGFFSSGVFEAFMEAGIMFPYIAGISAGAANALSYMSGQHFRSRQIIENYVGSPKYVSVRNLIFRRSMLNFDFIFREIPQERIFFDWVVLLRQKISFNSGAFDCETGETVWHTLEDMRGRDLTSIMASCAVPVLCHIIEFKGRKLLDGGIASSISIEKSIEDGNDFHVIVLTRNAGFLREPDSTAKYARLVHRRYPKVAEALDIRHERYNRQLSICERLESEGKALIIRPGKPLEMSRTEKNIPALLSLHDEGLEEGRAAVGRILKNG
ncbi:MAG: patatin family protein [Clostridiales bacterium]|nr:patatin family protein [Clostridiales bacterium]